MVGGQLRSGGQLPPGEDMVETSLAVHKKRHPIGLRTMRRVRVALHCERESREGLMSQRDVESYGGNRRRGEKGGTRGDRGGITAAWRPRHPICWEGKITENTGHNDALWVGSKNMECSINS